MSHDTALRQLGQRQSRSARQILGPLEPQATIQSSPDGRPATRPDGRPRSLYIHVPFCFHKCHYCDFYSLVDTRDRQEPFTTRLIAELQALSRHSKGVPLDTIFVGGGTPTLLRPDLWCRLLAAMHEHFDLSQMGPSPAPGEWTVECNPETATPELMAILQQGGVNRVSIGAQSFDPRHLKTLERWHDPANVARALGMARDAGIARQSIDLIHSIPGQTLDDWRRDLDRALELGTSHLSCYSLTYEPNTAMTARMKRGEFTPIDEDLELEMHQTTLDTLRAAGFERYEVSNYARIDRSGADNRSRHNLAYWRQDQWLAAGPAASAHIAGHRWKNTPRLDDYLSINDDGYAPIIDLETPDPRRALAERLMTGLRISEGLDLESVLRDAAALPPKPEAPGRAATLANTPDRLTALRARHIADDLMQNTPGRMVLTDAGFLLADGIAGEFMECLDA